MEFSWDMRKSWVNYVRDCEAGDEEGESEWRGGVKMALGLK